MPWLKANANEQIKNEFNERILILVKGVWIQTFFTFFKIQFALLFGMMLSAFLIPILIGLLANNVIGQCPQGWEPDGGLRKHGWNLFFISRLYILKMCPNQPNLFNGCQQMLFVFMSNNQIHFPSKYRQNVKQPSHPSVSA